MRTGASTRRLSASVLLVALCLFWRSLGWGGRQHLAGASPFKETDLSSHLHLLPGGTRACREDIEEPACRRRVERVIAATFRDIRFNHPLAEARGCSGCCQAAAACRVGPSRLRCSLLCHAVLCVYAVPYRAVLQCAWARLPGAVGCAGMWAQSSSGSAAQAPQHFLPSSTAGS